MGSWFSLIEPANAVVGLFAAIVGVALVLAQTRKIWREGSRLAPPAPASLPLASPSAPATVAPPAAQRPRWHLGLVVLAAAVVVAVSLRFSAWPSPTASPRPAGVADREVAPAPREASVPTPSEVVLTTRSFTVAVP